MLTTEPVDDRDGGRYLPTNAVREDGQPDQTGDANSQGQEPEHAGTLPVERATHLRGQLREPGIAGQQQMEVEEIVRCERRPDA
jgi:hypothetical protein